MSKKYLIFQLTSLEHHAKAVTLSTDGAVLIGRGDSCDVKLKDPSASRVHCRIIDQNGRIVLYDAGSRWGTFVNSERVSACELRPGDRIDIGETTIRVTEHCALHQQ